MSERDFGPLFVTEEGILQSISARAPLPQILNEICSALDLQIGNMVSIISLLEEDDASRITTAATNAAHFGLYVFHWEDVVAGNGDRIGFLEMYGTASRSPTDGELLLIERAKCLAAAAIKLHCETYDHAKCELCGNPPSGRPQPEPPVSVP